MSKNMNFFSRINPPPINGEVNSGQIVTDSTGYVPADKKIRDMISAGERLIVGRAYDLLEGEEDGPVDPTRAPNFDLSDYSVLKRGLEGKKAAIEAEKKRKAKLIKKASVSQGVQETPKSKD